MSKTDATKADIAQSWVLRLIWWSSGLLCGFIIWGRTGAVMEVPIATLLWLSGTYFFGIFMRYLFRGL